MLKDRSFKQRGKEVPIAEIPNLIAVRASGSTPGPLAGTGEVLAAQNVVHVASGVDPAQVKAFQKAGWQFVEGAEKVPKNQEHAKVLVKPGGRLVLAPNRLSLKLGDKLTEDQAQEFLASHGLRVIHRMTFAPNLFQVEAECNSGSDVLDVAAELSSDPLVDFAEPEFLEGISTR
jgi:hypothetical protein